MCLFGKTSLITIILVFASLGICHADKRKKTGIDPGYLVVERYLVNKGVSTIIRLENGSLAVEHHVKYPPTLSHSYGEGMNIHK